MTEAPGPATVGARLAAAFRRIADTSFRGLPICNDALAVEAVGFSDRDGLAFGVVITPWFMKFAFADLPGGTPRPAAPPGATVRYEFPEGPVDFTVGDVAGIGRVDSASLFSPMFDFADQDAARATAEAALAALLAPPPPPPRGPGRRAMLFGRAAAP